MKKRKINVSQTLLFIMMVGLAFIYALPNFYNKAPSVVVMPKSENSGYTVDVSGINQLNLKAKIEKEDDSINVKFKDIEDQMKGYEKIKNIFNNEEYYINLTLLPSSPKWLDSFNAKSASLGLDLMGGVHFLMEVDTDYIEEKTLKNYRKKIINSDLKNIKGTLVENEIIFTPYSKELEVLLFNEYSSILSISPNKDNIKATIQKGYLKDTIDSAVKQNIFILKNRVNELGVAEPIVQREGISRIVVQLPGIQDTQKARDLIGTTASLYFKKVKMDYVVDEESEEITDLEGIDHVFYKDSIINGKSIIDASSGINPENNSSIVSVTLDSEGGNTMLDYTSQNIGTQMGSILVETSYETVVDEDGNTSKNKIVTKKAINVATIQGTFSNRFQITGLDNKDEAHNLAILLRSGSLAAPVDIIEERTIGPNMGAENIKNGKISILIGFIMVLILMVVKYRGLGLVANFCVLVNLLLLLSLLSMIGATLTLPGIAGMLLTVGMAVDGNVVIFERIKEEYQKRKDLKKAIKNGYGKALSSIVDANVTTFIAAFILFCFGTGPVKGFAITLSIGIITSLITSIYLSRFLVEMFYSNKKELKI